MHGEHRYNFIFVETPSVKEHCTVIDNVIISTAEWFPLENESLESDSLTYVFVFTANETPRPQLLYVSVYWLTYHEIYR